MRDATVVHGHVEKELMEEVLLFGYRCLVIDAVTPPPPVLHCLCWPHPITICARHCPRTCNMPSIYSYAMHQLTTLQSSWFVDLHLPPVSCLHFFGTLDRGGCRPYVMP